MMRLLAAFLFGSAATVGAVSRQGFGALRSTSASHAVPLLPVQPATYPKDENIHLVRDPNWNGRSVQDGKTFAKDYPDDENRLGTGKSRVAVQDGATYHEDYTTDARLPSGEPVAQTVEQKSAIVAAEQKQFDQTIAKATEAEKLRANNTVVHQEQKQTISKQKAETQAAVGQVNHRRVETAEAEKSAADRAKALEAKRKELEAQEQKYAAANEKVAQSHDKANTAKQAAAKEQEEADAAVLEGQKHAEAMHHAEAASGQANDDVRDAKKDLDDANKVVDIATGKDEHKSAAYRVLNIHGAAILISGALLRAL